MNELIDRLIDMALAAKIGGGDCFYFYLCPLK